MSFALPSMLRVVQVFVDEFTLVACLAAMGSIQRADINSCLQDFSHQGNFELTVREVDIERSDADDFSSSSPWDTIFAEIESGKYDVLIMSPP